MSHTSSVKSIKIQSVVALRNAIKEMKEKGINCSLVENATPRAFYNGQAGMGVADFVLQLQDSKYDVGLYKQQDGSYEARTDFFLRSVENVLGVKASSKETELQAKMGKFFQAYAVCAAEEAARKKGYMCRRVSRQDGAVSIVVTGNL